MLFFASPQIRSEINWCFKLFKLFQVGLQEKPFGQGAVSLWKFSGSRTIFLLMSQYSRRGCSFSQFSCPPGPRTTWQSLNLSGLFWHLTIPGSWNSKIFAYDDWEESSYIQYLPQATLITIALSDNFLPQKVFGTFWSLDGKMTRSEDISWLLTRNMTTLKRFVAYEKKYCLSLFIMNAFCLGIHVFIKPNTLILITFSVQKYS